MLKIEYLPLSELKPYARNAKLHPAEQIEQIKRSIQEFGFNDPIAIWGDNTVIEGHGRLIAATEMGLDTVPVIRLDDLTDEQRRAYTLVHNKLTMNSELDPDILAAELDGIFDIDMSDFGFDFLDDEEEPKEIADVEAPEQVEPRCKVGDLWQLGGHRLICGDSQDARVVAMLMDGEKADCVFTDPPYNIASDSKNYAADVSKAMRTLAASEWDKGFDIEPFFEVIHGTIADDATVYICASHFTAGIIWDWMRTWSDHYSYCVWSKPNPMPSLSKRHWTWNTELVCYATRGKHTFNFPEEGHALSTWTINKQNGETEHPTEKPVAVPAMGISHSSKPGDVVLDLFGGSGSTLIACEQLDRRCFMSELDPHYCDVIVERWENFTGNKAVLLNE